MNLNNCDHCPERLITDLISLKQVEDAGQFYASEYARGSLEIKLI
jgi:hypothetical protein